MHQLWTLGIRDKQLLYIIRQMLKAPIRLKNGQTVFPTKGTPQGGILSPLLANVNLNELDWWVAKQWNEFETRYQYTCKHHKLERLVQTKLKPMYIVRYADDFKIFTNNRSNANKIYHAVQQFLNERLKLPMSEEKSSITNLKKHESELSHIRRHPIEGIRGTIEVNDNRLSLYVAQKGKCAITGKKLMDYDWYCHHKIPWSETHDDTYKNLILILADVHKLIHATVSMTIQKYLNLLRLDGSQLDKVNKLRKLAGNIEIQK